MLRIKYELISRGISQTEFAKSAGLKPQAVSRIVNGLEPPYTKRGERIAAALGWEGDPSELFEEVTMYAKPTTLGQLQADNAKLRNDADLLRAMLSQERLEKQCYMSENAELQETLQRRTEQFEGMTNMWAKRGVENFKLRELVADMWRFTGTACKKYPRLFDPSAQGGQMVYPNMLDSFEQRMRELGVEVDV